MGIVNYKPIKFYQGLPDASQTNWERLTLVTSLIVDLIMPLQLWSALVMVPLCRTEASCGYMSKANEY